MELTECRELIGKINELEKTAPFSPEFKNLKTDLISRFWTGVISEVFSDLSVGQLSAGLCIIALGGAADNSKWGEGAEIMDQMLNGYTKDWIRMRGQKVLISGYDLWSEESLQDEPYKQITNRLNEIKEFAKNPRCSVEPSEEDSEG